MSFSNATTDAVVRLPSKLAMTVSSALERNATHEYVVPRSMPIAFDDVGFVDIFL